MTSEAALPQNGSMITQTFAIGDRVQLRDFHDLGPGTVVSIRDRFGELWYATVKLDAVVPNGMLGDIWIATLAELDKL